MKGPLEEVRGYIEREQGFRALVIGASMASVFAAFVALRLFSKCAKGDFEIEVAFDELPRPVRQALLEEMSGGKLLELEMEMESGRLIYEAEYEKDGQVWEIEFDSRGNVLEKELEDDEEAEER